MADIDAILFDLDDTLLGNDMNVFLASYFPMLAAFVQPMIDRDLFLSELMTGTQAMIRNQDPKLTNREVFWSVFSQRTGLRQSSMEPFVNEFYEKRFCDLESTTTRLPVARKLVEKCIAAKKIVVVATNPLFPRLAIEHRLAWAGLPVDEYDFALVTAYENMHSTKPNMAYYQEILNIIGVCPEKTVMVGDDWDNDIAPASQIGIQTYWIQDADSSPPDEITSFIGQGNLEKFHIWLVSELQSEKYRRQ